MSEHRYILEPYKGMNTRYRCPSCQQSDKTFSLYIDTETGEHIHPSVGRCNRESNCGHHYTPKQYFQAEGILYNIAFDTPQAKRFNSQPQPTKPPQKPVSFIPVEVFKKSLQIEKTVSQVAENNHFVKFLIGSFGFEVANQLISRYFIASSKHWNGATVFWQIDAQGKVRTGKIMLYSPTTGKRDKDKFTFAHKLIKQPKFELRQCLFGEHLLSDATKPVAIVESEKTAVIASIYLPKFIWVASSGLHGLNIDKFNVLRGRTVTLFPDLSKPKIEGKPTAFEFWNSKAKELSHLANVTVSDLLERKATEAEKKQGFDLADYLIQFNYKEFALLEPKATEPPPAVQPLFEVKPFEQAEHTKPENWEQDITELENYFAKIAIPTQPVKLNPYTTVTNCSLFIESHFATLKASNGKRVFLPYLNRLQELKRVLN